MENISMNDQVFILDPKKANDFFSRNVKSSIDAINRFENRKTQSEKKSSTNGSRKNIHIET